MLAALWAETNHEKLADMPAETVADLAALLHALADVMYIDRRPTFDLERRLIANACQCVDRLAVESSPAKLRAAR